eukprot:CAMPEP_0172310856 /NCGR_PEP_ID=MMETSP1058-20130122/12772_1 /TAXON_ID=83371 /ORGANISM="Detonula confervacea, Strain CCMP 353" /LENGTH=462 /DNA_ID=CAMNT_0013023823 /DNA_START=168 /DNA_END=1553 /DNA_ORIENTATION=-
MVTTNAGKSLDAPKSGVGRLLASLQLEQSDDVMPPISAIFPNEIQKIILRHLDWQALIHLRATNRHYCDIITNDCQDIWKARHDARWTNGKRRTTWLAFKGLKYWSRTKNWTLHAETIVEGNWYNECLRRSRLDQSVAPRLLALDVGQSQQNEIWYGLMADGQDIVDCLKVIVAKERKLSLDAWMAQRIELPPSTLQVVGEKVLTGISRSVAYQEWKFLHDPVVKRYKLKDRVQLEDGAIAIAKFYDGADQIVTSDWIHSFAEVYVLQELDQLANIVKGRLHMRSCGQIGSNYPILEVLEEMKFLFNNSGLTDDDDMPTAFSGNVDDYYHQDNSLIHHCLHCKTGIPITLSVIYTSIVRRVCGVQLDIIGLPGHIVVGVPANGVDNSSRVFVDPFHEGRILSYADCQNIVARYNMTFNEDMVKGIPDKKVWERMARNLISCHSMQAIADDANDDESESTHEW